MVIDSIELESQIDHLLHEHHLRKLTFRFSYLFCCYWLGGGTHGGQSKALRSQSSPPTWVGLSLQFNAPPCWRRLSCFCCQGMHIHVSIHMGTHTRACACVCTHNMESKTKIMKKEFKIILGYKKSLRVAWVAWATWALISKKQTSNSIYLQCPWKWNRWKA